MIENQQYDDEIEIQTLLNLLRDNKIEEPKIEEIIKEIEDTGFNKEDFFYSIKKESICSKLKPLPNFTDFPFNKNKELLLSLEKRISSYMECITQLKLIEDSIEEIKIKPVDNINIKEIVLSGFLSIYFSMFAKGNNFTVLDLDKIIKNIPKDSSYDTEWIRKIFTTLKGVRDEHFSHKVKAVNMHILGFYSDLKNKKISISIEENHFVYFSEDKEIVENFNLLVKFTNYGIKTLLNKDIESLEKILNDSYLNDLNSIKGFTLKEYQKYLDNKRKDMESKNRDDIWRKNL